jgi:hypothetical protein
VFGYLFKYWSKSLDAWYISASFSCLTCSELWWIYCSSRITLATCRPTRPKMSHGLWFTKFIKKCTFPAFFPGKFWTLTLQANLSCNRLANPFIWSSIYSCGVMKVSRPIIVVIFLLLAFSAIIWIPLNVPYLYII